MSTLTVHEATGFFARIAAFFTVAAEIIREARALHAAAGGKFDE